MLSAILFETRLGEWVLAQLEKRAGLAIVKSDWLGRQEASGPAQVGSLTGPQGQDGVDQLATPQYIIVNPPWQS